MIKSSAWKPENCLTMPSNAEKNHQRKMATARAVIGFFPANSQDDDVMVYTDETRTRKRETLHHLRQQNVKAPGRPNYCLSDFIAPVDSGKADYIGGFAVTTGIGIEAKLQNLNRIMTTTARLC